jgi:hypothetical protein
MLVSVPQSHESGRQGRDATLVCLMYTDCCAGCYTAMATLAFVVVAVMAPLPLPLAMP